MKENAVVTVAILSLNFIFLLYELYQMSKEGLRTYFTSMWNCIDITSFIIMPIAIILKDYDKLDRDSNGVMACVYGALFLRGMSCMRIFNNLRYLINMIIEIIKDMSSFITVLVYWIVAISLIFDVLNSTNME